MRYKKFSWEADHRESAHRNALSLEAHINELQEELDWLEAKYALERYAANFTLTRPEYLMGHYPEMVYHPLNTNDMAFTHFDKYGNATKWVDSAMEQLDYSIEYTDENNDWNHKLPIWAVEAYRLAAIMDRHRLNHSEDL